MTAMDLLRQSQTDFTDSETLGVSEEITYYHKNSLVEKDTTRCFVNDDIYNDPKKNTRVSECVFSNVSLNEEPIENEEILYNDRKYKVKMWTLSQGRYIITAEHKRHHVAKRVATR